MLSIPLIYSDVPRDRIHGCSEYCLNYCDLCGRGVCEDIGGLKNLADLDGARPLKICMTCHLIELEMRLPYRSGSVA